MPAPAQIKRSADVSRFLKDNWVWFAGPLLVMLIGALVVLYLLSDGGQSSAGNVPYELI